jgi:hypothetical protein
MQDAKRGRTACAPRWNEEHQATAPQSLGTAALNALTASKTKETKGLDALDRGTTRTAYASAQVPEDADPIKVGTPHPSWKPTSTYGVAHLHPFHRQVVDTNSSSNLALSSFNDPTR